MKLILPFEPVLLAQILNQAGFEAYLVGGAVRDLVIQSWTQSDLSPTTTPLVTDYDLTTNATPEQLRALFPESYYENQFGTVSLTHAELLTQLSLAGWSLPDQNLQTRLTNVMPTRLDRLIDLAQATKLHTSLKPKVALDDASDQLESNGDSGLDLAHPFEITTYRSEGLYTDHRRPEAVTWGNSITEDLTRRDFTVNAVALKLKPEWLTQNLAQPQQIPSAWILTEADFELIDPHHGLADLAARKLRTVGSAQERFAEDALRMLRAIRLSVQLNFEIDSETLTAISHQAELLRHVSFERIRDEFLKMLSSQRPDYAVELLDQTGLLKVFLPEALLGKGVFQGGHHTTDVWTHSLDALAACPSFDPIVRLATWLHDVGKPATQATINGQITFYNHEIVGSRIVSKIGRRLRLSTLEIDRLFLLVRLHMFHYQPENTDASIRRFMRKVGLENIDDILDLREGDRLGSGARKTSWRLEEFKHRMIEQLHQPLDVTDLAVNGHDLMSALELKPGPILGKLLNELFELVMEQPELNTKEKLIELAKKLIKTAS